MKGLVLDFSIQSGKGIITADNGCRYDFDGSQWKCPTPPVRGMAVDFEVSEDKAISIYKSLNAGGSVAGSKNKVTAGILALLFGGLGIHKFYLGFNGVGLVFLLTNTVGWFFTWILFFIPNAILSMIALAEGIIYLTKSDEDFEQDYIVGKKKWF